MATRQKMAKADRRQAIVAAAIRLFAERGFRGVTTRELAREVGVSEPVLYEHFRTKQELYLAIIEGASSSGVEEAADCVRSLAATCAPREFLLRVAQMIADFHVQHPEFFRLFLFSALEGNELADLCFERRANPIFETIVTYLRDQMAAGVLRKGDPAVYMTAFKGMISNYCLFELHFGFRRVRASKKRMLEGMVDIFLNGIQKT